MLKPFLLLSALLLLSSALLRGSWAASPPQATPDAPPAEFKIPPEAAAQVNPIRSNGESVTRGKKIYAYECAMCHGEDGGGAGDLAKNMKAKMPDFRDPATLKAQSDGALFYIIKSGKGEMEGEGARVKTDDIWNLVNYVHSFSKGQSTASVHAPS